MSTPERITAIKSEPIDNGEHARLSAPRPSFRWSDLWRAPLHDFPIRDEILLSYFPLSREMEVLEIGPGSGFTAFWLARQVRHVTLLDVAEETVGELREQLGKLGNLDFVRGDVSQPGLANILTRRFDAIFGLDVFEYIVNPAYSLKNLCSVLRPGGCLFLTFPNTPPPKGDGVTWFSTAEELETMLGAAGFRRGEIFSIRVRPYARRVYAVGHEWPLHVYRRLRKSNPAGRPQSYEATWAFQNRRRWSRYRGFLHFWWSALAGAMRIGGAFLEIDNRDGSLLERQLVVRAWR